MAEKLGRPPVYQTKDEKPATVSLRIPRDLYEQAQRYVGMRRPMTLTDLLLDGLRLRLETPADPRDLILSDDNTVIRELQEMIQAAVKAEVGKLSSFMQPHFSRQGVIPPSEPPAEPVPALSHDDNTILQENNSQPRGRRSNRRQPIITLLHEHPEGLSATELKVYLHAKKSLSDTIQGMVRAGILKGRKSGRETKYIIA